MGLNRRGFLKTLGASAAACNVAGTARAEERPVLDCDNQWSVLAGC